MLQIKRVLAAVALLAVSSATTADTKYGVSLLSLNPSASGEATATMDYGLKLRIGKSDKPYYAWASYDENDTRILGQSLSNTGIAGIGLGAYHKFGNIRMFAELGYAKVIDNQIDKIRDEIIYTVLVKNHENDASPIPFDRIQDLPGNDSKSLYELEDGIMGRIGAEFTVSRHISITTAYRYLVVDEHYEAWDESRRAAGGGWWQETTSRDFSAYEIGIVFRF